MSGPAFRLQFGPGNASFQPIRGVYGCRMTEETERRRARRYAIALPVRVLPHNPEGSTLAAETRDISFRGLYFKAEASFQIGSEIEFILTLPRQVTLTADVQIRCHGQIVRVEEDERRQGVAARIDRYDFLPTAA